MTTEARIGAEIETPKTSSRRKVWEGFPSPSRLPQLFIWRILRHSPRFRRPCLWVYAYGLTILCRCARQKGPCQGLHLVGPWWPWRKDWMI